jgi:hypothetical protein
VRQPEYRGESTMSVYDGLIRGFSLAGWFASRSFSPQPRTSVGAGVSRAWTGVESFNALHASFPNKTCNVRQGTETCFRKN